MPSTGTSPSNRPSIPPTTVPAVTIGPHLGHSGNACSQCTDQQRQRIVERMRGLVAPAGGPSLCSSPNLNAAVMTARKAATGQADQRWSLSSLARGAALSAGCPAPCVSACGDRSCICGGAGSHAPIQAARRCCWKVVDTNSDNAENARQPSSTNTSRGCPSRAAFATARRSAGSLISYRPSQKGCSARSL